MKRRQLDEHDPNQIVRLRDGPKYFGYKLTQQDEKIKKGRTPAARPFERNRTRQGLVRFADFGAPSEAS